MLDSHWATQGPRGKVSDVELLARVGDGDQTAFAEFYDRFSDRVFGLLLKLTAIRSEAEDLLQQTFLKVWRQASTYDASRASPTVWVNLLARTRAIEHWRRRQNHNLPTRPLESEGPEPLTELQRRETAAFARTALARIPEEQANSIRLAFFSGLTHEQIASLQRIPLGTVKTRIRRGMQRLQEILSGHDQDRNEQP